MKDTRCVPSREPRGESESEVEEPREEERIQAKNAVEL